MKSAITHCVIGAKSSSERGSVEKPPSGIVVSACAIASKGESSSSSPLSPIPSEDDDQDEREADVEQPEPPCGVADPLGELVDLGPGQLRLEHLTAADPEAGEHREREDDDPHPAEPLAQLPPDQHGLVERARRW